MNELKKLRLEDINLRSVVRDVLAHFWVILLVALSAWMLTGVVNKVAYEPTYTSTVTFAVSTKGNSNALSNLSLTKGLTEVFSTVFESNVLKTKVAETMGVSYLDAQITATVIPETNLLKVSATGDNPEIAFRTLTLTIENYESISEYLFDNAVLTVLKEPNVPMAPSNSVNTGKMQKEAAVVGAFLAIVILALLSARRETIQTKQTARHQLEGELFGSISHDAKNVAPDQAKSTGKKKVKSAALITNPLVSYHFMEDCQKLCSRLDYYMKKYKRKVLLISSAAENEGKSTVAANMALALAERNKKVLLIDCDFRKPSQQKIFGIEKGATQDFVKYILNPTGVDLSSVLVEKNGVVIAASHVGYEKTQQIIANQSLKEFIEKQKHNFDYIILDSPPMLLATDAQALLQISEEAMLVVRQDWSIIRDINDCIDVMRSGDSHFLGYVLNNMQEIKVMKTMKTSAKGGKGRSW